MADVEKYNIGLGAWADGTWNKGGQVGRGAISWATQLVSWGVHGGAHGGGGGGGGALLWKPHSESDGRLVILVGTYGGTLTVNGVRGVYVGQTNGGRATYRFPMPGSGYGTNVKVVHSHAGSWNVPNGAHRTWPSSSAGSTKTGQTNNPADDNSDKPRPTSYIGNDK